jgi:hypothetical protein
MRIEMIITLPYTSMARKTMVLKIPSLPVVEDHHLGGPLAELHDPGVYLLWIFGKQICRGDDQFPMRFALIL